MLFKYYYYIIKKRGNTMNDTKKIFDTYCDFVTKVTSEPSLDINSLKEVIDKIENESDIDAPRILTAALGLSSEAGEFTEIVKKNVSTR